MHSPIAVAAVALIYLCARELEMIDIQSQLLDVNANLLGRGDTDQRHVPGMRDIEEGPGV